MIMPTKRDILLKTEQSNNMYNWHKLKKLSKSLFTRSLPVNNWKLFLIIVRLKVPSHAYIIEKKKTNEVCISSVCKHSSVFLFEINMYALIKIVWLAKINTDAAR